MYNLQVIISFCLTVRDKKKMYEGFWDGHKNGSIAWPDFCRSGALTPVLCYRIATAWGLSLPTAFTVNLNGLCGIFQAKFTPFPQSIAEVETPISEGNCSAAAAKCHRHTKMLIYVAQRQHGKQAPGSSVLFHFFFLYFLSGFSHKKWYRASLRSGTECLW